MGKILQILIIENRDLAHAQTFCTRVAVSMKNYVLFRRDRPTHAGGIAAYIDCDIPCQIISTPTLDRFHLSPFPPETPDTQDTSAWEATVNLPSAEKRILLSIFRVAHRNVIYKAKRK